MEDAPADLGLAAAAQRVEHYEIAAYTTARNMAIQLHQPAVVDLLTRSLGEEQNAGPAPEPDFTASDVGGGMPASVA